MKRHPDQSRVTAKGSVSSQPAPPDDPLAPTTRDPSPHPSIPSHQRILSSNSATPSGPGRQEPRLAFSLAKFIPLLSERIYVISPFTRSHLVSWITILDSIPDLELVSYLPDFLDGLLKYLSDPNPDVKIATENVLSDFLREIKHIARVQRQKSTATCRSPMTADYHRRTSDVPRLRRRASKLTLETESSEIDSVYTGPEGKEEANSDHPQVEESTEETDEEQDNSALLDQREEEDESSAWIPGQGVWVDHAAIMDIMIGELSYPGKSFVCIRRRSWLNFPPSADEQIQSIALRWIASFLTFVQDVMVPFTPRLIPAVLPNLAHHVPYIQSAAMETNRSLFQVIQSLPISRPSPAASQTVTPHSLGSTPMTVNSSTGTVLNAPSSANQLSILPVSRKEAGDGDRTKSVDSVPEGKSKSKVEGLSEVKTDASYASMDFPPAPVEEEELFDLRETVNVLTLQFMSEHEETRIAALEWLQMLHGRAPNDVSLTLQVVVGTMLICA